MDLLFAVLFFVFLISASGKARLFPARYRDEIQQIHAKKTEDYRKWKWGDKYYAPPITHPESIRKAPEKKQGKVFSD